MGRGRMYFLMPERVSCGVRYGKQEREQRNE